MVTRQIQTDTLPLVDWAVVAGHLHARIVELKRAIGLA